MSQDTKISKQQTKAQVERSTKKYPSKASILQYTKKGSKSAKC